jgi:RecA/RadA recombinase
VDAEHALDLHYAANLGKHTVNWGWSAKLDSKERIKLFKDGVVFYSL